MGVMESRFNPKKHLEKHVQNHIQNKVKDAMFSGFSKEKEAPPRSMMHATLRMKAEHLASSDILDHKADAFFKIRYDDETFYKSETIKNSNNPEWEIAKFDLPKEAFMRTVNLIIKDDNSLRDDIILDCNIRYPFRKQEFTIAEKNSHGIFAKDGKMVKIIILDDEEEPILAEDFIKINEKHDRFKTIKRVAE